MSTLFNKLILGIFIMITHNTCGCGNNTCNTSNMKIKLLTEEILKDMLDNGILVRKEDIYIASQSLVGTTLITVLNNGTQFENDLKLILDLNLESLREYADSILKELIGAASE